MTAQERHPDFLDDQASYFDELITDEWDSYIAAEPEWGPTRRFEIDQMLARAGDVRTVLDVGCGSGKHDVEIADRPGIERVVGIDYSPRSIAVANREHPHPKVTRSHGDIFEIQPDSFDLVFSVCVLPHLRNPVDFLAACRLQTAKGGVIVATTPNCDRLENRFRRALRRTDTLIDPQHFAEYTLAQMIELGRAAGLEPFDSFAYGLQLTTPWWTLMPRGHLGLGHRFPSVATRMAVMYRVA